MGLPSRSQSLRRNSTLKEELERLFNLNAGETR
jgi:hypothetical protein